MSLVVLKIYTPQSKSPQIVKIRDFPCSIGRAIKNDIILHDDAISGHHAIIEREGNRFIIRDQDSRNGLFMGGLKRNHIVLENNLEVLLGHCRIQFFLEEWDSDLTQEIDYSKLIQEYQRHDRWRAILNYLLQVLALTSLAGLNFYLNYGLQHQIITHFAGALVSSILLGLLVSSVLSGFSKLQNRKYFFGNIVVVVNSAIIILYTLQVFGETIDFMFGDSWFREVLSWVVFFSLFFWFLFSIGKILFPHSKRSIISMWVGGFLGICTFGLLGLQYFDEETGIRYAPQAAVGYPLIPVWSEPGDYKEILTKIEGSVRNIEKNRGKILQRKLQIKDEKQ